MSKNSSRSDYLQELLSIFWLRPETALLRTFDCLLMDEIHVGGRSGDFGCGDGALSFIMAGGRILNYDVFLDMGGIDRYREGADVFNVPPGDKPLEVDASKLRHQYTWGIDHKEALVSKARRFGEFYRNTMILDLNQKLPFEDAHFDTIFSNVLYWLDDIGAVLAEWRRVLAPGGTMLLFVPDEAFRKMAWLYHDAPHDGYRSYFNFLDRGYKKDERHLYSESTWRSLFESKRLEVNHHVAYLTEPVMEIYNIGTRPIFPLLMGLLEQVPPGKREKVKQEWIAYFRQFFVPIVDGEAGQTRSGSKCAFHFFVLKKVR